MSRSGRRARRARLIAAGQWNDYPDWSPSGVLHSQVNQPAEQAHLKQVLAERDEWIYLHGILGWRREMDRRRAERVRRWRQARQAR